VVTPPRTLRTYRLGRVEYQDGLELMRQAAERVRAGDPPGTDYLFLLEHPPVLTLGRNAERKNILAAPDWLQARGVEVYETERGGEVTYHGPGQIVGYPVVDLNDRRDVRRYVKDLEEAMVRTCSDWGVTAERHPEHHGAWVATRKIGAVGVHISRWITRHGFAFNVAADLGNFQAIVPCGIGEPGLGVTSLAGELAARGKPAPIIQEVEDRLGHHLAAILGRRREDRTVDRRTVAAVAVRPGGEVLLLKRTPKKGGFWQPVTGRIEAGESPETAARREVEEELGTALPVEPLGYVHAFAPDPALSGRDRLELLEETAFLARAPAGWDPKLGPEHSEHAWLPATEALERLPYAGLKRAVRLATRKASGAWQPT
jgi:lipoyl(octanoyl) transferase